jgi:acyl-CoA synthetase (AMP-forming)/AMP-acid ligase II
MTVAATVGDLLDTAVREHPEREALVHRDARWKYAELGARVVTGSRLLREMAGARPRRVALIGANHAAYVLGYLAAQRIGAATVEIGRDESLANIERALAITGAAAVLTDRSDLLDAGFDAPTMTFEAFLKASDEAEVATLVSDEVTSASGDEASVVFTSGTTGTPKGVVLSHGNILFVAYAVREYLSLAPEDRYALVLPLAHTYGKSNLLSAMTAGAAVVLIEDPHDPAAFYGRMMRERCTVLSVVPFHLNVLARRGLPPGIDLTTLRAITTSGGPLPEETARGIAHLFPDAKLYSMYGLTESSTRATYLPPEWLTTKTGSVGRPLPGVQLEIRDDEGRVQPAGVIGHVLLRGPNVMQGYLGDADLTAQVLRDGWLDTGDLGYLDADGCLFLTGREKEIIKVAGERISPGEIEEVLFLHPSILDAAVVGVPHPLLGETVWAYVVRSADAPEPDDIAAFCAARLSPHKVPRRFIETEHIPRTPTGKVRRYLLKERSK